MYVAVKGGERAIANSHVLLAEARRGDPSTPELSIAQIEQQLRLAVDRVMTEGSVYDRELAALAIKQAAGDNVEAIFLLRAYRATLPRFGYTEAINTVAMQVRRRISATFKDLPGGQVLGPTYDYTQRLLDFSLMAEGLVPHEVQESPVSANKPFASVMELLGQEGLIEPELPSAGDPAPGDWTRQVFPRRARSACRIWRVAMKAIYWRWVIPHNAVTQTTIRSQVKFVSARLRWKW
jgi:alpha-D-ribose 1-methylphosphonate 5-triphosphate synthase subunit PhnI